MHKVTIVAKKDLSFIEKVDKAYLLKAEYRKGRQAQQIIQKARDKDLWLLCDCKSPGAIMIPCLYKDSYSLKNHYSLGEHDIKCPFYTEIKGERDTPSSTGSSSLANLDFTFAGKYGEEQKEESKRESAYQRNKSLSREEKLIHLLDILFEESFSNILHADRKSTHSIKGLFASLRKAAEKHQLTAGMSVKDRMFYGPKGYYIMKNILDKEQTGGTGDRPLGIWLCDTSILEQEHISRGNYKTILEHENGALSFVANRPVKIPGYFNKVPSFSSLAICLFGFTNKDSSELRCLNLSRYPLHRDTLLPVDSLYESKLIDIYCNSEALPNGSFLRKPVVGKQINNKIIKPDFVLGKSGNPKRVVLEVLGIDSEEYKERKKEILPLMSDAYGPVIPIEAYRYNLESNRYKDAVNVGIIQAINSL